jgi:membrane protein insertase Oxa1/YidC/SpoIIIJ
MHHNPIYYCRMPAVMITLLIIMSLFMPSNLTSMLVLHMVVSKIVMIFVLVLISTLPTSPTIQKPNCRPFPKLTMSSFADVLRLQKILVCTLRGGNQGHALYMGHESVLG